MRVGTDRFKCPRCGEVYPLTTEYWSINERGYVTGYCRRGCHAAWWRAYVAGMSDYQRERTRVRHRNAVRDWYRRTHGVTPDRYRVATEDAS